MKGQKEKRKKETHLEGKVVGRVDRDQKFPALVADNTMTTEYWVIDNHTHPSCVCLAPGVHSMHLTTVRYYFLRTEVIDILTNTHSYLGICLNHRRSVVSIMWGY